MGSSLDYVLAQLCLLGRTKDVAKIRLGVIVRNDRAVCETARWRLRPSYFGSRSDLAKAQLEMLAGREVIFRGKRITREELSRMRKPRYRWEVRR